MKIAITGATGQLGPLVIALLKAKAPSAEIIALARQPAKATDLGVNVRQADYDQPATLDPALTGIDTLLLISGSEVGRRTAQHRNVIEAAKKAGVRHLVYTSLLHANTSPLGVADEHRATEAAIKSSGLPFTFLRNAWYVENQTGLIPVALANGRWLGSAREARFSSAPREDYAEATAAVLAGEGHAGKTYELGSDDAFTLSDLAAEVSRQTGKTIPYRDLPQAEYAAALQRAGVNPWFAQALAGSEVLAIQGALYDDSRQLSALLGRPTTPLSSSVSAALQRAA